MRVHETVLAEGEYESGITIHYVNNKYDEGNIIRQEKCIVTAEDTPETLAQKVHELEYKYYPKTIDELISRLPD
jgi:phosphoribosylglycinamide formyltransferase-1